MSEEYQRIELITGTARRRHWSTEQKLPIIEESFELARQSLPPANRKRVHRIMHRHSLLLERCTGRREGRVHDGKVMVMCSNLRWCSDGLEFTCWNGEIVRMAFIID